MIMQWDAADAATADALRSMDGDAMVEWLEDPGDRISFDVDKAWHAIHFTLAGHPWNPTGSLGSVVLGGEPFGEDIGYDPARWLSPDAVAAAAAELDALSPEEFASRLSFEALAANDVYPQMWDQAPAELIEYVVAGYSTIRDGFIGAAAASQGFVINLL